MTMQQHTQLTHLFLNGQEHTKSGWQKKRKNNRKADDREGEGNVK